MKILLFGPTGLLGAPILLEAANRGHLVTALCRHPEQIAANDRVTPVGCDVFDTDALAEFARGHDAVVHAYSPRRDFDTGRLAPHLAATRSIIAATERAGVARLVAVGGAGALLVAPGVRLVDTPRTPPQFAESGRSMVAILALLEAQPALDWTFPCPSGKLVPRGRTGSFRLGDTLLVDADGENSISPEDYAIAVVDELEIPRHRRREFAIGY